MSGTFRFFDHTGDFGVEVEASSAAEAIGACARAFLALLVEEPDAVGEVEVRELEVEGVDPAGALVALGNELLFLFESEGFLCARLEPVTEELDEGRLRAVAHGEGYDPDRHAIARPAKAVTHHGATLAPDGELWRARLVFDL